jgi:hypothetical protein
MTSTDVEIESERESPKRNWNLRTGFVGTQGIRSGWSALIFLAIIIAEVLLTRVPVNYLLHYMKAQARSGDVVCGCRHSYSSAARFCGYGNHGKN